MPLFFISINIVYATSDSANNELTLLPSTENDYPNEGMKNIDILFSNSYQASTGSFYVNGAFKNVGNTTLENVKVIGYFYDDNKKMIGVTDCCYAEPDIIEIGKTARFESFATGDTMTGVPIYYKLSLEWNESETNTIDSILNTRSQMTPHSISSSGDKIDCGDVIKSDIKLTSNLYCNSDGLIIQDQNDLTIDLNGHTISGPGEKSSKVGILIGQSNNVEVTGNGAIKNFQAGVLNIKSKNIKIVNTTFTGNELGVFNNEASDAEINNNSLDLNSIGISSHSSDGLKILKNSLDSNDLAGITFQNSGESTISSNTVTGSVNGIFFDGQSSENDINANNVIENRGVDMNNGNGLSIEENDNTFSDNNCITSVPDGLCLST